MIYFYSGTPGSGKSLHVARDILLKLKRRQGVIANFPINDKYIKKGSRFEYMKNSEITPKALINYAIENHIPNKENQTLLVIDECQIIFNPRTWQNKDRLEWIEFFTQHRKFGYNVILISQFDRLVDKQIRSLFEYEVKHRKVNNFKIMQLFPISTFCAVTVWYGIKEKVSSEFFIYRKKYSKIYNSYLDFKKN